MIFKEPLACMTLPLERGQWSHSLLRAWGTRGFSLSQIPQTREGWASALSESPGFPQASLDIQLVTGLPTLINGRRHRKKGGSGGNRSRPSPSCGP